MSPPWLTPAQREAFRRGEARAAEATTAGKQQLEDIETAKSAEKPVLKRKLIELRPNRWKACPVCHAPAVNPASGECEMASCASRPDKPRPVGLAAGGPDADPSRAW